MAIAGAEHELYPPEFINALTPPGTPPHVLELHVGQPVILLRNINPPKGLTNGTRLIINSLLPNAVLCTITSPGPHQGSRVFIPRIIFKTQQSGGAVVQFTRRQFPLRVAYAMTINKSQGQTLNRVGIYLQSPPFAHGQLYVALSRVTSPQGIRVLIPTPIYGVVPEMENRCTYNPVQLQLLGRL